MKDILNLLCIKVSSVCKWLYSLLLQKVQKMLKVQTTGIWFKPIDNIQTYKLLSLSFLRQFYFFQFNHETVCRTLIDKKQNQSVVWLPCTEWKAYRLHNCHKSPTNHPLYTKFWSTMFLSLLDFAFCELTSEGHVSKASLRWDESPIFVRI